MRVQKDRSQPGNRGPVHSGSRECFHFLSDAGIGPGIYLEFEFQNKITIELVTDEKELGVLATLVPTISLLLTVYTAFPFS